MADHEIVFDRQVSKTSIYFKIKATLIVMHGKIPAKVKVVTPNEIYYLDIT